MFGSPGFRQLAPPVQALMQVAVKTWLTQAKEHVTNLQLDIIQQISLLHAEDYQLLLDSAVDTCEC